MKTLPRIASLIICLGSITTLLHAQTVPQIINYQGRVLSGSTNFDGSGSFKFALVNAAGTTTFWSNNNSSVNGSEPSAAVSLTVTKGLYSVLLGDTSIANMTSAIPSSVFTNSDVRLRVWFNDGTHGSQLLTPDQRVAAVGYTFMADNIKDGAITMPKLATGAVGSTQLASGLTLSGTTTGTFSGSGAALTSISASNVTTGTLPQAQLPATVALRTGGNNFTGIQNITGDFGMEKIQAANSNNSAFMEFDTSTGGSRGIIGVDGNGFSGPTNQFTIGSWTNTPLALYTNQVRRMTILSTGNVGIGIDTPAATLDVAGAINIPATTSATNGVIQMGGAPLIHAIGTQNVFLGIQAGNLALTGTHNTGVGFAALEDLTTGTFTSDNTAVGWAALDTLTSGSSNTAVGAAALGGSTSGGNTAIGFQALQGNTNSSNNTGVGIRALTHAGTSADNVAIGADAGRATNTGVQNTVIGSSAFFASVVGSNNTAVGYRALFTSTAADNTAMGWKALENTTGSTNIGIGKNGGQAITTGSNNIDIGNVGAVESNTIRIGTSGTQTATFIAGISGATASGGATVFVNASGQLGTLTSSRRFKTDIKPMDDASSVLHSLKPVTFHYKSEIDAKGIAQFGLIAEEVEKVCPDLVIRDEKGELQTVRYEQVNAMLLNEFLKEHKRIAEMKKEEQSQLAALRSENAKLREENAANAKRLATLETRDKEREARLTRLEISMPAAQPVANTIASSKTGGQ